MYTMSERGAEPAKGWTDPTPDSKATRETRRPGKNKVDASIKEFKPEGPLCKAIKARDWATAEALVLEDQKHSGADLETKEAKEKKEENSWKGEALIISAPSPSGVVPQKENQEEELVLSELKFLTAKKILMTLKKIYRSDLKNTR